MVILGQERADAAENQPEDDRAHQEHGQRGVEVQLRNAAEWIETDGDRAAIAHHEDHQNAGDRHENDGGGDFGDHVSSSRLVGQMATLKA